MLAGFYDLDDPANNADNSLPVPNVEDLYIGPDGRSTSGDEFLSAVQHAMPGIANPYRVNTAQPPRSTTATSRSSSSSRSAMWPMA